MKIQYERQCSSSECSEKGSEEYGGKYYCKECYKKIMRELFEKEHESVSEEEDMER